MMSSDGGEHSGKRFLLLLTIIAERNMTASLTDNTVLHRIMLKTNTSLTGFTIEEKKYLVPFVL